MSFWLIFILGAMIAGFVQGLTGFAFALIAMSFWIWILPPQIAAPLVVFASIWSHFITLSKEQQHPFKFSLVIPYLVAGLIGVPIGIYLLDIVQADKFKIILGSFLILWSPIMYFSPKITRIQAMGRTADRCVGLLGGVLGGLGGFCGAAPAAWVMLKNLPKDQQRYILRHFNFAVQFFTLCVYVWQGTLNTEQLNLIGILILSISLPAILGAQLFYKISEKTFNRVILSLLFGAGFILVFASL